MAIRKARQKSVPPIRLSQHLLSSSPNVLSSNSHHFSCGFLQQPPKQTLHLPSGPLTANLHTITITTALKCESGPCLKSFRSSPQPSRKSPPSLQGIRPFQIWLKTMFESSLTSPFPQALSTPTTFHSRISLFSQAMPSSKCCHSVSINYKDIFMCDQQLKISGRACSARPPVHMVEDSQQNMFCYTRKYITI